ncbi:hypothetical protein Poli38472_006970 [Pythium oligandrum]|uniref:ACB domain-containing protein n=1 Tax=Pythium oligandrum TaxID=41045 RepID=A0A8K1C985_PYTOL|nr:hypothetical protein Poli38472_006970 [Pythium oligandrum]|eukprot:TMW58825.1 hypothetical protein Poli38472_006970 [Pythium oligandrum]
MYFCSGPPRTYALQTDTTALRERVEDVAIAVDPFQRVVARVTSTHVTLWTTSARSGFHGQRLLVTIPRSGRLIETASKNASAPAEVDGVPDSGCADIQQLWAVWTTGDRLAVVERGSPCIEFYAFDGLPPAVFTAARQPPTSSNGLGGAASGNDDLDMPVSPSTVKITGRFLEEYALNQGESKRDHEDVAWSMTGIAGGKYLFVGMESGLISVVEVDASTPSSTWRVDSSDRTKLWKIDVLAHLSPSTSETVATPSCYAITTATWEPVTHISLLYLVACFEGGKCFIMLIAPALKSIEQLLSLVNTEREASSTCFGRCTTLALEPSGARLALGWSDGGISMFELGVEFPAPVDKKKTKEAPQTPVLQLQLLRELSMTLWGYETEDIGGVTTLAWTHDARAIAVGYEHRGFAVFSTDGCRLMSSLPQHNQHRPEGMGEQSVKEVCAFGALRLAWTKESMSLLVVSRGEALEVAVPETSPTSPETLAALEYEEPPAVTAESLFELVQVELLKEDDGLCLSLSGAPGRCGAWVRSENSFTRRRDGGLGPAEACGQILGGDLLIAIDDDEAVVNLPFEEVITSIKNLESNTTVKLVFWRLNWEVVYPLAVKALASGAFMEKHGIQLLEEEDLCVREYALRMQEQHGDCETQERPPLLEFEQRAKFEGWDALQGTSQLMARHKYVKLLLALFPVWNPSYVFQALAEFANNQVDDARLEENLSRRLSSPRKRVASTASEQLAAMSSRRQLSQFAFTEYDFARSVPLTGRTSKLMLLEEAAVRAMPSPTLDDPCALVSCTSWHVPSEYEAKCCPLRLVAASTSGHHIAVAGQRGFCVLNQHTGKWRLFGNVNDEHDMFVYALLWIRDDVILASFTRFSEKHRTMHLQAYPRDHLDEASVLDTLSYPRGKLADGDEDKDAQDNTDCFFAMESDEEEQNAFCLSRKELWTFGVAASGSIKQRDLKLQLSLKRRAKLPSRILQANQSHAYGVVDFSVIPRVLHVQDEARQKLQEARLREARLEQEQEQRSGWISSIVHLLAGGEVPDQYKPEEVLPRFAFLDVQGNVIVWDPENRSQRLVCGQVTAMTRLFVKHTATSTWPTPCRLIYGMYGPSGMQIWLPLLDGVYLSHTKAFEADDDRLETFLACHDPLRAKTYEIEFGTAPATAELYEQVVREYGIELEAFFQTKKKDSPTASITKNLPDGLENTRGCITTVDDPAANDVMLRFDSDVKVLGIQQAFGLLVGVSQDVYMPSGLTLPCYDLFSRVQPFFHTVLCFLVTNQQLTWARQILDAIRNQYALSTPTQELFLHAMLEACFGNHVSPEVFMLAIQLLKPSSRRMSTGAHIQVSGAEDAAHTGQGDIDEYCEIVAHVARKSEPSRLKVLFPLVGDPLDLLAICRQRGELRTAANFLLILEECSPASASVAEPVEGGTAGQHATLAFRSACAAELVVQCLEHEEWALAKQVVRVTRDWEHREDSQGDSECFIDQQLGKFAWNDLASGNFERVVWCVEELQVRLPQALQELEMHHNEEEERITADRLREVFIPHKARELRVLLDAVSQAKYKQWASLLQRLLQEAL